MTKSPIYGPEFGKYTKWILMLLFIASNTIVSETLYAEEEKPGFVVSGHVRDAENGEELLGATILVQELKTGVVTNFYGFYSISLPPAKYSLQYSYIGYNTLVKEIDLNQNITLNVELSPSTEQLEEVEVKAEAPNANVIRPEMGVKKLQIKEIRKIPAFMGEVDVIKAIQLLPGVQTTSEGASGFSVRGGGRDQNLILLDEAPVYNASHLLGFFSVFNNDAIKDVKLYKGDIPASSGGRLSSLLDVRMKDGNSKHFSATGGIGNISSRLTLEGPIIKDQTSYMIAGRRFYADIFLPLANNEDIQDNQLYFYDLNLKINHRFNEKNRLFLSGYLGRDVFGSNFFNFGYGNQTLTMRWNHLVTNKIFMNVSVIRSSYDYEIGTPSGEANSFLWTSNMLNHSAKIDFNHYVSTTINLKYGISSILHDFNPGHARGVGDESAFTNFRLPGSKAIEYGGYISNEHKISPEFTLRYGLRYSLFQNMGRTIIYNFDEDYEAIDSIVYKKGDIFNTYGGLEPRMGLVYELNSFSSVKASYSRTRQYVHLASNSTSGTPMEIWFPSSPNIKPQIADQGAMGYFRNFFDNRVETSAEVYYKKFYNAIDFKDFASWLLNPEIEGEVRVGEGQAYGLETLITLNGKKVSGWVGYTLARSERTIPEINDGKAYLSPYDKTHDVSVVLNYDVSRRISIGTTWVYSTGNPVTFPTGRMEYGNTVAPVYTDRNNFRMPDYHRLDVSLTLYGKEKPNKRWESEWNLSVYNVYNRKNAFTINFIEDAENPGSTYAEATYLFGVIPAITYNFKF